MLLRLHGGLGAGPPRRRYVCDMQPELEGLVPPAASLHAGTAAVGVLHDRLCIAEECPPDIPE